MNLINGFDAIEYVTSPYSLIAFLFLITMVVFGTLRVNSKLKAVGLLILAVSIVFSANNLSITATARP